MKKEYRNFQVYVAPGVYGGVSLISGFSYFFGGSFLWPLFGFIFLLFMSFIDRPLLARLVHKRVLLLSHLIFIFLSCFLPGLTIEVTESNEAEFMGVMLVPIIGVCFGAFIAKIHTIEKLDDMGWVNISGRFE